MDNIQYFNHLVAVKDGLCALMFGELTVEIVGDNYLRA